MLWFLVPHLIGLLFWAASLLYLPTLIAGSLVRDDSSQEPTDPFDSLPRKLFTHVATPSALFAIIAGTLVFLVDHTVDIWLIAKLTVVAGLVLSHAATGLLILRAESGNGKPVVGWCWVLGLVQCVLMVVIVWLVLAKPTSLQVLS